MKLCFSTLGCPGWSWDTIFTSAKDIGMDGIEVRCIGDVLYAPDCPEFSRKNIESTKARLAAAGMSIPVLDSNSALAIEAISAKAMREAKEYIELASRLGTPYVRVMSIGVPQPDTCDLELCAEQYSELCEYGEKFGVAPLLETNGPLSDTAVMRDLMNGIKSENKGVVWDIHHPHRYFAETAEQSYENLAPFLRHVHVKDSVCEDGSIRYCLLGKGDVPVKQTLLLLRENGYDGFVSLEWVKKWNPEISEPGIVFPHFARYIKKVLG